MRYSDRKGENRDRSLVPFLFVLTFDQNAATHEDAHKIASRVSTSALVKTALYGEDAK